MFTGIIQAVGVLRKNRKSFVDVGVAPEIRQQLSSGASVAVDGVCLTVSELSSEGFCADVSQETTSRTTLGRMRDGATINVELPVAPQDALDGHIVLGHVDAVGQLKAIFRENSNWTIIVSCDRQFRHYLAEKGSVAIDGISLTPYGITGDAFRCSIIPKTYSSTSLQDKIVGAAVNIEFDILAKYVQRMTQNVY